MSCDNELPNDFLDGSQLLKAPPRNLQRGRATLLSLFPDELSQGRSDTWHQSLECVEILNGNRVQEFLPLSVLNARQSTLENAASQMERCSTMWKGGKYEVETASEIKAATLILCMKLSAQIGRAHV